MFRRLYPGVWCLLLLGGFFFFFAAFTHSYCLSCGYDQTYLVFYDQNKNKNNGIYLYIVYSIVQHGGRLFVVFYFFIFYFPPFLTCYFCVNEKKKKRKPSYQ